MRMGRGMRTLISSRLGRLDHAVVHLLAQAFCCAKRSPCGVTSLREAVSLRETELRPRSFAQAHSGDCCSRGCHPATPRPWPLPALDPQRPYLFRSLALLALAFSPRSLCSHWITSARCLNSQLVARSSQLIFCSQLIPENNYA
jgi:hypothetical protein